MNTNLSHISDMVNGALSKIKTNRTPTHATHSDSHGMYCPSVSQMNYVWAASCVAWWLKYACPFQNKSLPAAISANEKQAHFRWQKKKKNGCEWSFNNISLNLKPCLHSSATLCLPASEISSLFLSIVSVISLNEANFKKNLKMLIFFFYHIPALVFSSATPVIATPTSKRKLPLESGHSFGFSNKKRRSVKKNLGIDLLPSALFAGASTPGSGID